MGSWGAPLQEQLFEATGELWLNMGQMRICISKSSAETVYDLNAQGIMRGYFAVGHSRESTVEAGQAGQPRDLWGRLWLWALQGIPLELGTPGLCTLRLGTAGHCRVLWEAWTLQGFSGGYFGLCTPRILKRIL